MDFDQRPLAEALVDLPPHYAPHRVTHDIVVPSRHGREIAEGALGSSTQKGYGRARRGLFDQTEQTDRWWCGEASLTVYDQGGDCAAVQDNATPVLQRGAAERQETFAIARQPADRHLVNNRRTARGKPHHVAVLDDERLLNLALLGEMGMGDQMARFAVNRDRHPRTDHLVHAYQLVARGMAGNVDEMVPLGDDLDPEPDQRVLQPVDRLLVPGNDSRREDHDITRLEHDIGMVLAGDPGERRARLPLAPGADQHDLVARQITRLLLGQKSRQICEITVFTGGLVDPPK